MSKFIEGMSSGMLSDGGSFEQALVNILAAHRRHPSGRAASGRNGQAACRGGCVGSPHGEVAE
jgi:hypothetical protein